MPDPVDHLVGNVCWVAVTIPNPDFNWLQNCFTWLLHWSNPTEDIQEVSTTAPLFTCFQLHSTVNWTAVKKNEVKNCHKMDVRGKSIIFRFIVEERVYFFCPISFSTPFKSSRWIFFVFLFFRSPKLWVFRGSMLISMATCASTRFLCPEGSAHPGPWSLDHFYPLNIKFFFFFPSLDRLPCPWEMISRSCVTFSWCGQASGNKRLVVCRIRKLLPGRLGGDLENHLVCFQQKLKVNIIRQVAQVQGYFTAAFSSSPACSGNGMLFCFHLTVEQQSSVWNGYQLALASGCSCNSWLSTFPFNRRAALDSRG